jgi:hydrogenase maturation protease
MQVVASPHQTLVVGLGSHHGADCLGWLVARALKQLDSTVSIVEIASPGDLLDWMPPHGRLILCDGCQGAGEPGSVHRWRWPHIDLRRLKTSGTHDLSLADVLYLGESLGSVPNQVDLWGIELPADATTTDSKWLARVASRAAAQIHAELNDA